MRCDESDGSQLEQRAARRRATVALHRAARTHTPRNTATQTQTIGNDKQRELEDLKNEIKKKNQQLGRILMYILLFTMTRKAKAGGGGVHADVGLQWREMSRQQSRRSSMCWKYFFFFFCCHPSRIQDP